MAAAEPIKKVIEIIKSDFSRRFVVVSAPGKKHAKDEKITDILLECAVQIKITGDCPAFEKAEQVFTEIVNGLGLKLDIKGLLKRTKAEMIAANTVDFAASRGEYLSANVMAAALGWDFVDGSELIVFSDEGEFLPEETNDKCYERLAQVSNAVIPGFYGMTKGGKIKTFSRGGSDVTGAIVARAAIADLYENWTDVNGFLTADPRIIYLPEQINALSYRELRELSYMGASVLHEDSVFPVREIGIPINVKNTFNPENPGTIIVPSLHDSGVDVAPITGISGKKDYSMLHLEKDQMNTAVGFARKVLGALEKNGIPFEFMPSGIDTLSLVIESRYLDKIVIDKIAREIQTAANPDLIEITDKMAVIAIVGRNLKYQLDATAKIFDALKKQNIEVRLIDYGSSGLSIIVGVNNYDFEKAISAIYAELTSR